MNGPKGLVGQISLSGSPLLDIMFSQTELATRDELYIDTCPNAKTRTKIHLKVKAREMKFIRTLLCGLDFILNVKSLVECSTLRQKCARRFFIDCILPVSSIQNTRIASLAG